MKKGFGLIEVLFAAVVLGFLVVGLTRLQLGNREGILRIRARDVANTIAQDVMDSISTMGLAAKIESKKLEPRIRKFSSDVAGNTEMEYDVEFEVKNVVNTEATEAIAETELTKSAGASISLNHEVARQIDVTVSWIFKKTPQSISVSSVIR